MPLRVGQGFDSHPLSTSADRPLVLGGVTIPGSPGLVGHSDADVVTHALADAVLGAIGHGDLGRHFPDTDPSWAGADSLRLLAAVMDLARRDGLHALAPFDHVGHAILQGRRRVCGEQIRWQPDQVNMTIR